MNIEAFCHLIRQANSIALLTHENPDIDGLACMLSFLLVHPQKKILPLVEKIPETAYFLHGKENLKLFTDFPQDKPLEVDLIVVFDAQCDKRIPREAKNWLKPKAVLIFDHHQREDCASFLGLSPLFLIQPEEPSTTALFYKFLVEAKYEITPEVAENLLAGIYYDTGGFRYENVKGDIFLIVHKLIELGARPYYITQALFENTPLEHIEVLKLILSRLELLKNGTVALSYLKAEDIQRLGGEKALNDFASFLRSFKGVKVSALLKEVREGEIKVSLRSKAPFEILPLAQRYGGGGHKYACGFTIKKKDLFVFWEEFKEILKEFL